MTPPADPTHRAEGMGQGLGKKLGVLFIKVV